MDKQIALEKYNGQLSHAKRIFIDLLEKDGYGFTLNDNQNFPLTKYQRDNEVVRVSFSSKAKPRFLWAVKQWVNK